MKKVTLTLPFLNRRAMSKEIERKISALSDEQRRILARRLAKAKPAVSGVIRPLPRHENRFPLSFAQQRLWFLDQIISDNKAFILKNACKFQGVLDQAALQRSLDEIVRRHEILRTTFISEPDGPLQVIAPPSQVELPFHDLTNLEEEKKEAELTRILEKEGLRPFNLADGPLFRVNLIRLDPAEHVLLIIIPSRLLVLK